MVDQDPEEILLPARPPTPPRESNRQQQAPFNAFSRQRVTLSRSSSASNITPNSSIESPTLVARKKVGFSDSPQYSDPHPLSFDGKEIIREVQPLPPSAERKPSKSILKAYRIEDDLTAAGKLLPPHQHKSFAKMLESIVLHLSKGDRSSKLDGYMTLSGSLKASETIPDVKALRDKTSLLCQFISRDLIDNSNGKPDYPLIIHALTLLSCLMFKQTVAECIPTDFQVLFVDYAIKAFADGGVSKEVARHLLLALTQQNFSPKVMNSERVGRLIAVLHKIEDHYAGKSIVQSRIQIYRVLTQQSKPHMLTHTLWISDLLTDMLSSLKEVRLSAITFGLESSFALGTEKSPSSALNALLKFETEAQVTYADFFANRLKEMIKKKEDSANVPQIWSVIILFQRYKPQQLETWKSMSLFLGVLQLCFNNSDKQTTLEAHYAWNRLIFALHLTEQTSSKLRGIAFRPLIAQLKTRKTQSAYSKALGSLHNLLYYAFRPNSTTARLDIYWDEYVAPLVEVLTPDNIDYEFASRDATNAATILLWLFETTTPRKWTETRAMDNLYTNQIQVNELPSLDSKWLRKNASRVHHLLSRLLDRMYWNLSDKSSIMSRLWHAYITSIASPAAMEVKVAIETMMSIASTFGYLYRTWNNGPAALPSLLVSKGYTGTQPKHDFLLSFENILTATIHGLGELSFTEKLLSIKQDTFEAVTTPSHQPKKMRSEIKCPLHHLVLLLSKVSPGLHYDIRFYQMTYRILWPFIDARKTRNSKLDLIKDLMSLLPSESLEPVKLLWQVLAKFASIVADTREDKERIGLNDEPLGSYYRSIVKVLEIGIRLSPNEPMSNWKTLLDSVATSASLDAGDAGKAIAVIEPLARALLQKSTGPNSSSNELLYLQFLFSKATFPKDRQALDAARKKLWGTSNSGAKLPTFDPYERLYEYLQKSLEETYSSFSKQCLHIYADTIFATSSFLNRCPSALLLGALTKSQQGLSVWVIDKEGKLGGGTSLGKAIINLWSATIKFVPRLLESQSHTKVLAALEILICSGLESKHKTLVNTSINAWNSTFGASKSSFEYPERVKSALMSLRAELNEGIDLPFFPESLISEPLIDEGQHPRFTDSQDDYGEFPGPVTLELAANNSNSRPNSRLELSKLRSIRRSQSSTPQVVIEVGMDGSLKRSRESTPDRGNKDTKRRATTPRLRHDDSQIQFEAVESSPIADRVADSQLLTERQKETRARQQEEAAMFPDLRSSPRARTKSLEPELPVHRSSSKLRNIVSPGVQRQATPTLVQPSDDEPYADSSPTPTRSVREGVEAPDFLSPEPSAAGEMEIAVLVDEIPSSPPRDSPEPMNDIRESEYLPSVMQEAVSDSEDELPPQLATLEAQRDTSPRKPSSEPHDKLSDSLGPSAQQDPFFFDITRSLSSYVPTPEGMDEIMSSPSRQLRASEAESDLYNQSRESIVEQMPTSSALPVAVDYRTSPKIDDEIDNHNLPGELQPSMLITPIKSRSASPIIQQTPTPKTPQFVDANSSPVSSNNEFEDAVENSQEEIIDDSQVPLQLDLEKIQSSELPHRTPSPTMSDLDESSIMRVMDEYDQGSGRPAKQVSFVSMNEDKASDTRVSRITSEGPPASSSRKLELVEQLSPQQLVQVEKIPANPDQSSSMPSLIPETPGRGLILGVDDIYNDDGKLCTLEDTIVVDTTEFDEQNRRRALSSRKGSGRRKSLTPSSKKRNFAEVARDLDEVPDSQGVTTDAQAQGEPTKSSPTKRVRGRYSRRSFQQNQQAMNEDAVNQSFQSVELDASFQLGIDESRADLPEAVDTPNHLPALNDAELMAIDETNLEIPPRVETFSKDKEDVAIEEALDTEKGAAVEESASKQIAGDLEDNLQVLETRARENELVEETIVYETTFFDDFGLRPAETSSGAKEEGPHVAEPETTPAAAPYSTQAVLPELQDTAMSGMFDGVKSKLQSVITDLRSAIFSRREVDELEDMFYEAKKELCIIAEKRRSAAL